jgi:uncharacterized protein (DUF58 family)
MPFTGSTALIKSPRIDVTFPSMSGAKNTEGHPAFRSIVFRIAWRFYTWRLTQAGRWLIWPTVGFLAYTSASLDIQSFIPLSYFFGLWLVGWIGAVLCTPKVTLKANHADRVCAGEVLQADLEIAPAGPRIGRDLFVQPHRLPPKVDPVSFDALPVPPPEISGKSRVRVGMRCDQRGVYTLQGFRVETDFPFGLFRAWQIFGERTPLLVYPRFTRLARLEIPMGRRYQPGGVALLSIVGDSAEYIGNREYREGDNIRDIDWRATARLDRMIVREYREEYLLRVAVILDTHVPKGSGAAAEETFERGVSLCAAVGDYLARQEYIVDLFAAGPNLYHLTAGRSLAYLDQILDILACVEANPNEPFAVIEPELTENLARISTIICVFLDWNENRRAFCERLREQGVGVKVAVVRDGACTIDPGNDSDAFGGIRVISKTEFTAGVEEL